jgi:hypothetical protein
MAKFVYTDAKVEINGTDISNRVKTVSLSFETDVQDSTVMGMTTKGNIAGLKNFSMDLDLTQDFVDNGLDETLWGLHSAGTVFAFEVRANKTTGIGPGNPEYRGYGLITGYNPIDGTVGDLAMTKISIVPGDDGTNAPDITRHTS